MAEAGNWSRPSRRRRRTRAKVDYVEMSVRYGSMKLQVPHGFKSLLEHLTREILREQPKNIPEFAAAYFRHLLQKREEGSADLYLVSERIVESQSPIEHAKPPPVEEPVVETRAQDVDAEPDQVQEQAQEEEEMPDLADPDIQKAAAKIQASFRGFQTRKSLSPQSAPVEYLQDGASTSSMPSSSTPAATAPVMKETLVENGDGLGSGKDALVHHVVDRSPVVSSDTSLLVREILDTESSRRHSEVPRLSVQGPASKKAPIVSSPSLVGHEKDSQPDDSNAREQHATICESVICTFDNETKGEIQAGENEKALEDSPVIEEPVVKAVAAQHSPVVEEPVVKAVAAQHSPVIEEPVVKAVAAQHSPVIEEPVAEAVAVKASPVVEEPAVEAVAAVEELVVEALVVEEFATKEEHAAEEPVAEPEAMNTVKTDARVEPVASAVSVVEAPALAMATEEFVEELIKIEEESTPAAEELSYVSLHEAPALAEANEAVEILTQTGQELILVAENQPAPFGIQKVSYEEAVAAVEAIKEEPTGPEEPSEAKGSERAQSITETQDEIEQTPAVDTVLAIVPGASQDDEQPAKDQAASEEQTMESVEHPTTEQQQETEIAEEPIVVEKHTVAARPEVTATEPTKETEATLESEAPVAQIDTKEAETSAEGPAMQAAEEENYATALEVIVEEERTEVPATEEQQLPAAAEQVPTVEEKELEEPIDEEDPNVLELINRRGTEASLGYGFAPLGADISSSDQILQNKTSKEAIEAAKPDASAEPTEVSTDATAPAATEAMEPVTAEVVEPDTAEATEPVTAEATELATAEAVEPDATAEAVEHVTAEAVEPVTAEAVEPVTAEAVEPVTAEAVDPVAAEAVEPVTEETVDPVTAEAVDPVTAEAVDPATVEAVEPVTAKAVEPVTAEAVKPATVEAVEPVTAETVEPVAIEKSAEETQEAPATTDEAKAEVPEDNQAQESDVDKPEISPSTNVDEPSVTQTSTEEGLETNVDGPRVPETSTEGPETKTEDTEAAAETAPEQAEAKPEELAVAEQPAEGGEESAQKEELPQAEEDSPEVQMAEGTPI